MIVVGAAEGAIDSSLSMHNLVGCCFIVDRQALMG